HNALPISVQMFENTINYIPEYYLDADGRRERFKVNRAGEFLLKGGGTYSVSDGFRPIPRDSLIEDRKGKYFRRWRPEIRNADDIWQEIVNVSHLPGLTSAPKLQPIERSEEHTSELQSRENLVCRLLLEKKKQLLEKALQATAR